MPKAVQKTLSFPLAGVSRRGNYRDQSRPYATPWAVNVRGECSLEDRARGGSRPGLVKVSDQLFSGGITAVVPVTYMDSTPTRQRDIIVIAGGSFYVLRGTTATTADSVPIIADTGVAILSDDGSEIVFPSTVASANPIGTSGAFDAVERYGRLYMADSALREYNPATGIVEAVAASAGTVPAACPLVTLYRDRLFLAGADHVWYASRQGDPTDWDFGCDMNDDGRAVAGQAGRAGLIGDVIQAMIPNNDTSLTFATRNSMHLLRGEPTDGSMVEISNDIGVLSPTAWARSPGGIICFLSYDGVYVASAGSADHPTRWSAERCPDKLRNIDPATNRISMAYDVDAGGFHLFVTPATGRGVHWWLDIAKRACWPVDVPEAMQPVAVARLQGASGMPEVVIGCADGYLRKFDATSSTDDGEDIWSHVIIGPFPTGRGEIEDAMVTEIHGILSNNSGVVGWNIVTGQSAEEVSDKAEAAVIADLAGEEVVGVSHHGRWMEKRNRVQRPRSRGPWAAVWLASTAQWAYEGIAVAINQLGRVR